MNRMHNGSCGKIRKGPGGHLARLFPGNFNALYSSPGRKVLILAGLLVFVQALKSQKFAEVDSTTYKLYLEKDWNELIRAAKGAFRNDIDYYYLRMRIGIAYYEKKNYKSAQSHFRKALEFNTEDPIAREYLYYAYLFGGQVQQAALLHSDLPEQLQKKVSGPGLKPLDRISVEYLYNRSYSDRLIDDQETFESLPYGVQILTRNYQNLNLALDHCMHPGTAFRHAYTYLVKDNAYYYDDGLNNFLAKGHKVRQHQYFLSPYFTFLKGLVISPSFHYLHVSYQVPDLTGGGPGPGGGNDVVFREDFVKQLVGGLSLAKYAGPLIFSLGGIWSNLNNTDQASAKAGLTWYPRGNLDLYIKGSLNAHFADLSTGDLALVPDLLIGYGIASKVWIEFNGTYGEMKNFTESNGYIVYNGLDWMTWKARGNITVPLTEKGSIIYAGVRFAGYKNQFIPFDPAQPTNLNDLTYNSLSIFGGISWNF